jgi:hypothetical protein
MTGNRPSLPAEGNSAIVSQSQKRISDASTNCEAVKLSRASRFCLENHSARANSDFPVGRYMYTKSYIIPPSGAAISVRDTETQFDARNSLAVRRQPSQRGDNIASVRQSLTTPKGRLSSRGGHRRIPAAIPAKSRRSGKSTERLGRLLQCRRHLPDDRRAAAVSSRS